MSSTAPCSWSTRKMLHFKIDCKPQSHVRKLASKFRCDFCLKEFDYNYRYERHVETTFHKDKVHLMEICASTEAEWESGNVDTGGFYCNRES